MVLGCSHWESEEDNGTVSRQAAGNPVFSPISIPPTGAHGFNGSLKWYERVVIGVQTSYRGGIQWPQQALR